MYPQVLLRNVLRVPIGSPLSSYDQAEQRLVKELCSGWSTKKAFGLVRCSDELLTFPVVAFASGFLFATLVTLMFIRLILGTLEVMLTQNLHIEPS